MTVQPSPSPGRRDRRAIPKTASRANLTANRDATELALTTSGIAAIEVIDRETELFPE